MTAVRPVDKKQSASASFIDENGSLNQNQNARERRAKWTTAPPADLPGYSSRGINSLWLPNGRRAGLHGAHAYNFAPAIHADTFLGSRRRRQMTSACSHIAAKSRPTFLAISSSRVRLARYRKSMRSITAANSGRRFRLAQFALFRRGQDEPATVLLKFAHPRLVEWFWI